MTKADHMIKVSCIELISFGICFPFPTAKRFCFCSKFIYLVETILRKKQNEKHITCKNNCVKFFCFLTGNKQHTVNYIQLMAEQLSKYAVWNYLFNCYWHQSVSLTLKDWYHTIDPHIRNNNFPESNLRKLSGHLYSLKNFLNKCLKNVILSSISDTYVQVLFPPTMHQYPWMLSETTNSILFKVKCNLASSYQRHTLLHLSST